MTSLLALAWHRQQNFAQHNRIATMENSFGGIQLVPGMSQAPYCAGNNAADWAKSWKCSPELRTVMIKTSKLSNDLLSFFRQKIVLTHHPEKPYYQKWSKQTITNIWKIIRTLANQKNQVIVFITKAHQFGLMMSILF